MSEAGILELNVFNLINLRKVDLCPNKSNNSYMNISNPAKDVEKNVFICMIIRSFVYS